MTESLHYKLESMSLKHMDVYHAGLMKCNEGCYKVAFWEMYDPSMEMQY